MIDTAQLLKTFVSESGDLLSEMEQALLGAERSGADVESVNALFRAAHTIKGSAGLFGLDHIVDFTHLAESVLERVRTGTLPLDRALIGLLLRCGDHLGATIAAVAAGSMEPDPALQQAAAPLRAELHSYLDVDASLSSSHTNEGTSAGQWHLSLRFDADVLRCGLDPLAFLGYLSNLGNIGPVLTVDTALPGAADMDPEVCYLGFELALDGTFTRPVIEDAFEFVREQCKFLLLAPNMPLKDLAEALAAHGVDGVPESLVHCGTLTAAQAASLNRPTPAAAAVRPAEPQAALPERRSGEQVEGARGMVRVDARRLDELIDLVGELLTAESGIGQIASRLRVPELSERAAGLSSLVKDVRDRALQLRMVKIGATFQRFQRVVHDVTQELGKEVVLRIEGADTELDKTVVEKIGDPLMHLVRNALDHGIEAPHERLAAGKPACGELLLHACHDAGHIVIEVRDDGRGLDRARIVAKATERGIVAAGAVLDDDEVLRLIFEPGFSTASSVTSLSGRGVGMDVVKRNIEALRGSVVLRSEPGQGTSVEVRLPLTLAIIDGFMVGVNETVYAIPLETVEECIAFSAEPGHDFTRLRGQALPFVRLSTLFGSGSGNGSGARRREHIVVLRHGGQRIGVVVDALLGECHTVIKPLGKLFAGNRCVSGSTILGGGEVALILDVAALVLHCSLVTQRAEAPAHSLLTT